MARTDKILSHVLSDMKVELADMFDRNFEEKGFFGDKWKPRKNLKTKGSLLQVTGKMRRSIRPAVRGNGVQFTSSLPYTTLHNEGGTIKERVRSHTRKNRKTGNTYKVRAHNRTMVMPQRQFIGNHPKVQAAIKEIIDANVSDYFSQLAQQIKN